MQDPGLAHRQSRCLSQPHARDRMGVPGVMAPHWREAGGFLSFGSAPNPNAAVGTGRIHGAGVKAAHRRKRGRGTTYKCNGASPFSTFCGPQ